VNIGKLLSKVEMGVGHTDSHGHLISLLSFINKSITGLYEVVIFAASMQHEMKIIEFSVHRK
jgi:hypothetical protein